MSARLDLPRLSAKRFSSLRLESPLLSQPSSDIDAMPSVKEERCPNQTKGFHSHLQGGHSNGTADPLATDDLATRKPGRASPPPL